MIYLIPNIIQKPRRFNEWFSQSCRSRIPGANSMLLSHYTRVKCIVRYRTKNAVAAEYSHLLQSSLAEANKAGALPMVALLGRGNMIYFYIP